MYKDTKEVLDKIRNDLKATGKTKVVIGISGGIECTAALYLLKEAIGVENIICVAAPYGIDDEYPYAQSLAISLGCKYITLNIRKAVDWNEKMLQELTRKQFFGNPLESNVVERTRFTTIAMAADYFDAAVCMTTSYTKAYIKKMPFYTNNSNVIFPFLDYTRTDMVQCAIQLGCQTALFKTESSALEKELGFLFVSLDRYLSGVPGEPERMIELVEKLHNGDNNENIIK